ncbi:MAG: hypothetical protein QM536_08185 [Chitinophagaceae bacterium]|nr:hypothetical protein [Chitinophagaceae bacterium]
MLKSEEEYWELKKETERLRAENEKVRAENEKTRAENEKARAENEKARAENSIKVEKEWERISKGLDRLEREGEKTASTLRSLGFTIGATVEEIFLNSIQKTMKINGVEYYEIARNYLVVSSENGRPLAEIDALLFNKKYICVIEIKHRGTEEDMKKLIEKTIPTFQTVETRFQKYEIIPVLAAMSFDSGVLLQAKELKITLLKYRGEHFEVIH